MNGEMIITTQTAQLRAGLFDEFIRYIDRGEKTTRTYFTNLRQFAAWLRFKQIERPQRADIISYRDYLISEHYAIALDPDAPEQWTYRTDKAGNRYTIKCKANTAAQYLRSVCQFFRWTAANNLYPDISANIHAPKIRHDVHKKDALQAADVLQIEKTIAAQAQEKTAQAAAQRKDAAGRTRRANEQGKRLLAIYVLTVNAGLRTIEISRANVEDIERRGSSAFINIWGKGHAEADHRKPIAPEVYEIVKEYLDSRSDGAPAGSPLFTATGNRSGGSRLAATTISTMLKRAMQAAGFNSPRITAHSLRHTAGTAAQEVTGNIYITQQYMRHSNPATTEIYLHNETTQQEAQTAQKIYNYYHGGQAAAQESEPDILEILQNMNDEQRRQLVAIAAAMNKQSAI